MVRVASIAVAVAALLLEPASARTAAFTPIGHLEGGTGNSRAHAVSNDGTTVVGEDSPDGATRAFVWTQQTGIQALPPPPDLGDRFLWSVALGVSADGATIVGSALAQRLQPTQTQWLERRPVSWRRGPAGYTVDTPEIFVALPEWVHESELVDVSDDGNTLIGYWGDVYLGSWGFRWNAVDGVEELTPTFGGFDFAFAASGSADFVVGGGRTDQVAMRRWPVAVPELGVGHADDVSDDGAVVVGAIFHGPDDHVAFRWTPETGTKNLGVLFGDTDSEALGVSADGAIVVGASGGKSGIYLDPREAFVWDEVHGLRSLQGVLEADLGAALEGWTLLRTRDISADGRFVAGSARNPDGLVEAFVAQLPEPAASPLVAWIALACMRTRRPRRSRPAAPSSPARR